LNKQEDMCVQTENQISVVVKFDHNMTKQDSSQEATQGSVVDVNWFGSATDDEDNASMECGYESVE